MIDNTTLQTWLKETGDYAGEIDGKAGPLTRQAIDSKSGHPEWDPARRRLAVEQTFLQVAGLDPGPIDGVVGPRTQAAYERWITITRQTDVVPLPPSPITTWPRQRDVSTFYGEMGSNLHLLTVPYPIFYEGKPVKNNQISVHGKVAKSVARVLEKVLKAYGEKEIRKLRLDQYSGSFNIRKMKGGTSWSMHSWAIAIDWDAENNPYAWDHTKAEFARAAYENWWLAWEAEGWLSLGRARDFDWMHVQAARL